MRWLRRLFRRRRVHTVEEVLALKWLHQVRREGHLR